MKAYKYIVINEEGIEFKNMNYFDSDFDESEIRNLISSIAENYYDKTNSWGMNGWIEGAPVSIELFKEDESSLGKFNVEYELMPKFWVSEKKSAQRFYPC